MNVPFNPKSGDQLAVRGVEQTAHQQPAILERAITVISPERLSERFPALTFAHNVLTELDAFDEEMIDAVARAMGGNTQPKIEANPQPALGMEMMAMLGGMGIEVAQKEESATERIARIKRLCRIGGVRNMKAIRTAARISQDHPDYRRVHDLTMHYTASAEMINYLNKVNAGMVIDGVLGDLAEEEPGFVRHPYHDKDFYPVWYGFHNQALAETGEIFEALMGEQGRRKKVKASFMDYQISIPEVLQDANKGEYYEFDARRAQHLWQVTLAQVPWHRSSSR